eukprot:3367015-Alexandrium_andersonii.AAC.1
MTSNCPPCEASSRGSASSCALNPTVTTRQVRRARRRHFSGGLQGGALSGKTQCETSRRNTLNKCSRGEARC